MVGLIGPTRSAWRRSSGLVVRIPSFPWFRAGGLVAFPFSHASHRGLFSNFVHSGRVLRVSNEMCPYLWCSSMISLVLVSFAA